MSGDTARAARLVAIAGWFALRRRVLRFPAVWLAAWLAWAASPAWAADAYGDVCSGCHAVDFASTAPPQMLSQTGGASYGKILPRPDDGRLGDSCNPNPANTTLVLCGLRQKLRGENAAGTVINPTARSNMLSYATSVNNADLETVRQYLLQVRDGVVIAPSPAPLFLPNLVGAATPTTSTFSFRIANYRGVPVNYALGLTGANAADFTVGTPTVSGAGCSATAVSATATRSARECMLSVTVGFRPAAGGAAGTRSAGLHVTLTAPATPNLDPNPTDSNPDKTIALSATATVPPPAVPGFAISTVPLTLSAPVGTAVDHTAVKITNPSSATANLVLNSLTAPNPIDGGPPAGDYALTPAANTPCNLAGTTLAPGNECNLLVRFTPAAKGARNATLTIRHNAAGNPAAVALSGTGLQGTVTLLSLSPSPFGSVNVGSSVQRTLAVRNDGDAPLTFAALTPFTAGGDFSVNGSACTSPLAINSSCTLTLTFAPTAAGTRSATLTVNSNASNTPTPFALTGTGVGLADPTLSPAAIAAFPATDVGTTSAVTRTLTIANPRANPLTYAPAFGGANAADFAVGTESCPTRVVAAGGSCTLTLRFTPVAGPGAGTRNAALGLAFTGSGSDPSPATQTVALSGTATVPAPVFAISANPIGFSTTVGTPVTASATVSNPGNAALTLSALSFGGSFAGDYSFAPTNTCTVGASIAAGGSCTLAIRFAPAAPGSRDASLSIAHNAVGSPQAITLSGSASAAPTPAIDLGGTAALSFGSVSLGSSGQQGFSVRNTGGAPLNLAALALSGSAAADYARGGSCAAGSALAAGASCTVTVTFTPQAAGTRAALLTITSDASNAPSRSVTLSGDGAALAEPVISPLPIDPFPSTQVGSTSAAVRSVGIVNPRGNAITYARSLAGANAGDFAVSAESCPTRVIPPGGVCTVSLQFTPAVAGGAGNRSAALALSFTGSGADPAPAAQSLAVSGTAAVAAPVFAISSNPIGFAAVVGTPGSSSAVITNTGNAVLTLAGLTFGGSFAADYAFAPGNTCTAGASLAANGGTCALAIQFAPAAAGNRSASLSIAHNASGSPQAIALNGTATSAPQPAIDLGGTTALSFGSIGLGSSAQQPVVVRNIGAAPLNLSALTIAGAAAADFTRGGSCTVGSPVAAGANCTVTIGFAPSAVGARSAVLSIASDASNSPPLPTVSLSGSGAGLADPLVTPASVAAFPATDVGVTSATARIVTVTNPRANPLTYARSFGGINAADFSIEAESCAGGVVPAGGSCTLTLRFTPVAGPGAGTRIAALGLAFTGSGSDPSPATQTVALSGTATVPSAVFAISANPIGFSTAVATPVTVSAVITNSGGAALTLSSLTFGGTFAAEYTLAPSNTCTAGASIAANGGVCTLAIQFTPAAPGSRDAALSIAHNAAGSPQAITLSGSASAAPTPAIDLGGTAALSFGSVSLGSSGQQGFSVRNTGGAPLNLAALALSGSAAADYARGGSCAAGSALAAGASCTVTVTFTPQAAGTRAALLTITSDASNTPSRSVTLSGDGAALAEPVISPLPIDPFPSTQVGSTSAAVRSVGIVNPRGNAITYARSLAGANAADFAVSAESCPTRVIPPGGVCTVSLQFTPAVAGGAGNRGAALALSFTGSGADPAPAAQSLAVSGTAAVAAPVFSISAGTISLTAVVGGSASGVAVVSNTGSAALGLSALAFGGAFASDYSLAPPNTCTAPLSLAPGDSCTLAIRFTPPAAGSRDATLTISHDAAGSPQTLTLRGVATAAPQGRLELSVQRVLNFADTALGSSSVQAITLQNTGDAALNFASLAIGGSAAAEFERSGSCTVGIALAVNAQCSAVVTFRPTALGARSASITFQSDASNGAATIVLTGTAVAAPAPQVALTPAALAFGAQTLGGIYPKRTVRLTNSGSADLLNVVVSVAGAGFADASDPPCPATLAPGAGCDIGVGFTPTAAGASYAGSISITSNAAGSPHTAALTGTGTTAAVPVLAWVSGSNRLDFGTLSAGSVSSPQSVLVTNQGPGGAVFTLLNAVGPDAANFPVSSGTCGVGQPLFEGATCRIDVRFAPGSAGAKNATVQVVSSGSFPPTLSLTGTGLSGPNASLALSASKLSFDSTRVGAQSLPVEVMLTSDGSGVVRVTGLDVSGPYAVQVKSCPALPFTLPGGSACTVMLTFNPQAEGAAAGMLSINSDADPAQRQVALDGNAVPKADLASGGCSVAAGRTLADPTLWTLAVLAGVALAYRRRVRRVARVMAASPCNADRRDDPPRRRPLP